MVMLWIHALPNILSWTALLPWLSQSNIIVHRCKYANVLCKARREVLSFLMQYISWKSENMTIIIWFIPHNPLEGSGWFKTEWSCFTLKLLSNELDPWSTKASLVSSEWLQLSRLSGQDLSHHLLPDSFNWRCEGLDLGPPLRKADALLQSLYLCFSDPLDFASTADPKRD